MSIPPLPKGLKAGRRVRVANALHSSSIHLLRRARLADRESGLSPERLSLLSVLAYAGPQSASALAEIEGVSRPAISRIIKALEADGFIRRMPSPSDSRAVILSITGRGRHLVERARARRLQLIADMLAGASPGQLEILQEAASILDSLSVGARDQVD